MSSAELRAYTLYQNYNLSSLTNEVKQHLIVLLGGMPQTSSAIQSKEVPAPYTVAELRERSEQSWNDYCNGECHPVDELFEELEKDYPWAFK